MTCINEHRIQYYIDGECTAAEAKQLEQHLLECPICAAKHAKMQHLSFAMKQAINLLKNDSIEIPDFKPAQKRGLNRTRKLIIYSLSAACILLLVLFFVDKKVQDHPNEMVIVKCVPTEIDANKPASDQEFMIEVFDGRGNNTEYFIE